MKALHQPAGARARPSWLGRAASGAALLALAVSASAVDIQLFNTGVGANGNQLPVGSLDPHWQVVAGDGITTPRPAEVVTNQHPFGHYFETEDSMWIWHDATGSGPGTPYTFRLVFDLTGLDPGTASISGFWGLDDTDGVITLNGLVPEGSGLTLIPTSFDNFNVPHKFTITGGFVAGINHVEITGRDTSNPGGLNVTGLVGTAAVPEPASVLLLGAGIAGLIVVRSRRVRTA